MQIRNISPKHKGRIDTVKLSDFVISFIEKLGVKEVFLISGGGNIHLVDSVGKSKQLQYICNHHEQACATAAESYSRVTGNIGVCIVTTGPGGTNAITGVVGAWLDSIPVLIISGQVKRETIGAGIKGLRQLGDQEINIIEIVKPITKYAALVNNPEDILYHLEKATYIAKNGRPGPVWLDIPVDVQGSNITESLLRHFDSKKLTSKYETDNVEIHNSVKSTIEKLRTAKRPVLYVGNGVRLAGGNKELLQLVDILKIPVLTSYAGYDLIASTNQYFYGRAHAMGQRSANFILQNCDFLLSIGARLDIRTIGFTYRAFARNAYKVIVDIDKNELKKPFIKPNIAINADARLFIVEMLKQLKVKREKTLYPEWLTYGKKMISKYPNVQKEFWREKNYVNPYCFIDTIGSLLSHNETIVLSNGVGPLNCSYQALKIKVGTRIILNNGCAQMGYGLPAAIGAAFAVKKGKRIICFDGDGSVQLNIHELQVIKHHNLPIKLFIYSNDGYQSIRNTQNTLFDGKHVAVDNDSGVSAPDFVKIAKAYGLPAIRIHNHKDMKRKIEMVLRSKGPIICDIHTVRNLMLTPKLIARRRSDGQFESPPLEDMYPFLSREELKDNMIIPLWES